MEWEYLFIKVFVQTNHDDRGLLITNNKIRRVNVTSGKPVLNGYHKTFCFYYFRTAARKLSKFKVFFFHKLQECHIQKLINGVANLALFCLTYNTGIHGKSVCLPLVSLLERLHRCMSLYN